MGFYGQKMVKARKSHYAFCGKTIGGGERYSRERGNYEGDFFEKKLCLTCHEMLGQFCKVTEAEVLHVTKNVGNLANMDFLGRNLARLLERNSKNC